MSWFNSYLPMYGEKTTSTYKINEIETKYLSHLDMAHYNLKLSYCARSKPIQKEALIMSQ